ncbi:DNA replication complex gins protein sld5 [Phlyctema vagabunda]|uniref:DNA replication complex GINS protein SLD5 n=1 Tax=Phlyctema vagabunda TaxID=108571 RepID=A0ABR4P7J2_9HELO
MDIDDILRDATLSHDYQLSHDPFNSSSSVPTDTDSAQSKESDLRALTRVWVNERCSPELLAWPPAQLVERVTERIRRQIEAVEMLTGDMDPRANFGLIVLQTELERWKFLVRGLLRVRISKIDQYTLHYLSTPMVSRLSETEIAYATRHQALLHSHYLSSFLSSFPPQLQNLNDTAGGISMIGGPDDEKGVFARAVVDDAFFEGRGREKDGEVELRRGEVVVARWRDVREAVERGDLELV